MKLIAFEARISSRCKHCNVFVLDVSKYILPIFLPFFLFKKHITSSMIPTKPPKASFPILQRFPPMLRAPWRRETDFPEKRKMRIWQSSLRTYRVETGKFGQRVNSDIPLQTVEILMRRLNMSRLIRIFTVCPVNFVNNSKQLPYKWKNVTVRIHPLSEFTQLYPTSHMFFVLEWSDHSLLYSDNGYKVPVEYLCYDYGYANKFCKMDIDKHYRGKYRINQNTTLSMLQKCSRECRTIYHRRLKFSAKKNPSKPFILDAVYRLFLQNGS